ncbi:hypothetical protein D9M69_733100 [compost metagenome]
MPFWSTSAMAPAEPVVLVAFTSLVPTPASSCASRLVAFGVLGALGVYGCGTVMATVPVPLVSSALTVIMLEACCWSGTRASNTTLPPLKVRPPMF